MPYKLYQNAGYPAVRISGASLLRSARSILIQLIRHFEMPYKLYQNLKCGKVVRAPV
jgi:hypothetical protein